MIFHTRLRLQVAEIADFDKLRPWPVDVVCAEFASGAALPPGKYPALVESGKADNVRHNSSTRDNAGVATAALPT